MIEDLADLSEEQKRDLLVKLQPGSTNYERAIVWLLLTVVVSSLTVLGGSFASGNWTAAIYNGQMIIAAVTIFGSTASTAIVGDVFTDKDRNNRATVLATTVVFALACAFMYDGFTGVPIDCIKNQLADHCAEAHTAERVWIISLLVTAVSILAGIYHLHVDPAGSTS